MIDQRGGKGLRRQIGFRQKGGFELDKTVGTRIPAFAPEESKKKDGTISMEIIELQAGRRRKRTEPVCQRLERNLTRRRKRRSIERAGSLVGMRGVRMGGKGGRKKIGMGKRGGEEIITVSSKKRMV